MQTAFEELKVKLFSARVLAYPDYEESFVVCTDASSKAVGAVLSQADENGRDHTMHNAIGVLYSAESNYSAFEREELSVNFALDKFRHYSKSNRFSICTDHQALKYIFNMKDQDGWISHWLTLLAGYDLEIRHRAGRENACPDILSRPVESLGTDDGQHFEANLRLPDIIWIICQ